MGDVGAAGPNYIILSVSRLTLIKLLDIRIYWALEISGHDRPMPVRVTLPCGRRNPRRCNTLASRSP